MSMSSLEFGQMGRGPSATKVCRLCLVKLARGSKYFNINAVEPSTGFMPYRDQLQTCIPEMALDLIPNPVLCNVCRQALHLAYDFKKQCLDVEEKIRQHVANQPLGDEYDLSSLAQYDERRFDVLSYALVESLNLTQQQKHSLAEQKVQIPKISQVQTIQEPEEDEDDDEDEEEDDAVYCCEYPECSSSFNSIEKLQLHQSDVHLKAQTKVLEEASMGGLPTKEEQNYFVCPQAKCLQQFGTVEELHAHRGEVHTISAPPTYTCNFCRMTFKSLQLLRQHNSRCKPRETDSDKPPPVKHVLKKRPHLPVKAKNTLKRWLFKHTHHPYPTDQEKQLLMTETDLTLLQVENWFINARRRILHDLTRQKGQWDMDNLEVVDFDHRITYVPKRGRQRSTMHLKKFKRAPSDDEEDAEIVEPPPVETVKQEVDP